MTRYKNSAMKEARMDCQVKQLEKENTALRNHVFSLHGEVYGARLAAKYLDKELAGRYEVYRQKYDAKAVKLLSTNLLYLIDQQRGSDKKKIIIKNNVSVCVGLWIKKFGC